ncbi:MAG TPA: protein translocase subunit SecD [Blastocatellia bacterium]|nr:protein translocase subunit SecD [Blastocatellia bacterium]
MRKKIRTRAIIILIVTLGGLALVLKPHKRDDGSWSRWTDLRPNLEHNIHLGLDLKGGSHLLMRVDGDEVIKTVTERNTEAIRKKLEAKSIPVTEVNGDTPGRIVVSVADSNRNGDIVTELKNTLGPDWDVEETSRAVTATLSAAGRHNIANRATEQAKQIIENRVNAFGVAEPTIQRHGAEDAYQILIQMPGIDDPERVKDTLKAESKLEIRLQAKGTSTFPTQEAAQAQLVQLGPDKYEVLPYHERNGQNGWVILEKNPVVTGLDLRDASARPSTYGGSNYEIDFSLTPDGGTRFAEATGAHIGDNLAVVLNNEVRSIATIQARIQDEGRITGSFSQREAEDLALTLRSGALPAKAEYIEERTVGPSLGADSIKQGVTASVAGLLAVVAFMLFYYRGSGINAVLALVLNLILLMGALVAFGATLTLPGIAGIILTIGMAVDSNVLIFERIREELRNGKVVASAVDVGFGKAFLTIIDTHVTTIVSAVFLFVFGTGPIRGFAVTLVAGLLANLFTAVFVSRTIFMWHLNRKARVETLSI